MKKTNTSTLSSRGLAARAPALLALVCALAVPTASLARTVSVAAVKDGAATAAFGDPDGAAYTLAWGYGPADGGASTNAWAHLETLGEVAADAVTTSVPLPAGWGDTATHLRFFLLEPELPAAATRVEYVEATGTQWINTGVNLCSNDTVVAEYEYPDPIAKHNNYLFGVYKQGMTAGYFYSNSGSYPLRFQKANGTSGATTTEAGVNATPGAKQTVTMKIGAGTTTIVSASGDTLFSGVLGGTIQQNATAPLALFTANINGSPSSGYASAAKIYSFRIYDENGALRLDLVPCTVDDTPAMYDRVTDNYLLNGGTGDFSTGATMATPLLVAASSATASTADYGEPDAYLDYVESTGSQYINTGVNLCSNDTVVAEYEIPAALTKTVDLFGVHKHGMTARYVFSYSSDSGSSTIVFHRANGSNGATETKTSVTVTPGTRQTVTMKIGPGTSSIASASGETLYSGTLTTQTVQQDATGSLAIFACNSSQYGIMAYCPAKLYSFRIYAEDGSLAHHFLPCRKNDVAGLYDKATGKIHFATGGSLVAGPVLPRPAELVEWVQSDGASGDRQLYIDTGVPAKAGVGMTAEMEWATKPAGNGVDNIFCGAGDANAHIWLYDAVADAGSANATHRFGYYNWRLQLSLGAVSAGRRYRVEAHQAHGDQYLSVFDLAGVGAERSNGERGWSARGTDCTLYLFANNNAGTAEPISASARLYSLVLTNELGVARDFVPCVADNGKAGLYDRFSERVFFSQAAASSATSSDFDPATEIGAVTNSLVAVAEPPRRLRYIESDGLADFVNLGVIGRENVKMVAEMEWAAVPPGNDYNNVFCGASANGVHIWPYIGVAGANSSAVTPRMGYNGWRLQVNGTSIAADTRYRITTSLERKAQSILVEKFQNGTWVVDGEGARTNNDANWVNTQFPLYLFADNAAGTASNFVAARVYSLQLWQLNATSGEYELVRDLVPAKLDSGAAVLWDKVEARPLFNGARYGFAATGRETAWNGPGFMIRFW